MSRPREPEPAKLLVGVFLKERTLAEDIFRTLADRFGPVDMMSPWLSFDYTDYYTTEMGMPLVRRMAAFRTLIDPGDLAGIKLFTNSLEQATAREGRRRVNCDPGYLASAQFVLATGKNYAHRIYIGKGIYADLTLMFHHGGFESLPWTYPDYADDCIQRFLLQVRKRYLHDLKAGKS